MQPTRNLQYCVIHKIVPNREVSVDMDHVFIVPVKLNLNPKGDKTTKGGKNAFSVMLYKVITLHFSVML